MKVLLITYDNDMFIGFFPISLVYVAGALKRAGHEVEVYSQDKHHYPEEHLTSYLDNNHFDVVGVSVIAGYYQYRKLLKISDAINRSSRRPYYVIGGHGPSPEPEFFLRKTLADAAVIGEGELTVVELLDALENHGPLDKVQGIAHRDGEKVYVNERRPLIEDIDSIPFPAYELFPIDFYRLLRLIPHTERTDFVLPVLSGRGCTFKCTFCYRLDEGFRPRSSEGIIEEIRMLKRDYGINYISFQDELLMTSIERTVKICEDFIKANLGFKWACNGRLNYVRPEVMKLMKRAGCEFVNFGIESMDERVRKNMKKGLTTGQIIRGVETTLAAGLTPGLNIIFGNIGDTKESLERGVQFLLKYCDGWQLRTIRPVTPYPGSELYYHAMEKGLLKDCEDFYENKHVNSDLVSINFTNLSDAEFHELLLDANTRLIQDYYRKQANMTIDSARSLYLNKDDNFRGFRQT